MLREGKNYGRRNRGAQGAHAPPTFQRLEQSAPFQVTSLKTLKMMEI